MRLVDLTVHGFMEPFAGKTVSIRFADLPDGLIALTGDNGAGKTTLLEAGPSCIYREPMSRRKELETYAMDRDTFIESRWSFGTDVYTARLSMDGIKGGSAAGIRREGELTPLNDGKVTTYDRVIADLFEPLHLFKAKGFAAQNKSGSFVHGSKSERRDIVNAALTLDRWIQMSDTAKKCATEVDKVRTRVKADVERLEVETADTVAEALLRQRNALQAAAVAGQTRRAEVEREIAVVEQKLALLTDEVAAHAAATQRVTHLAEVLAGKQRELQAHVDADRLAGDAERRELDRLTLDHTRRLKSITDRMSAALARHAQEIAGIMSASDEKLEDIAKRLKGNADIQAMKGDIEAAVALITELTPQLATLRAEADRLGAREQDLASQFLAAERALHAFTKPQADLDRAKTDAALLADVPCGGSGDFAACRFLVNATAAQQRIVELEAIVAKMTAAVEARDRIADDKKQNLAAYWTVKNNVDGLDKRITAAESTAKYADKLAASDARVEELKTLQAAVTEQTAADLAAAGVRHAAELQPLSDERVTVDRELDDATTALQGRVNERLEESRQAKTFLEAEVATASDAHAAAQRELEQLVAGNQQASNLQTALAQLRVDRDAAVTAIATAESDGAAVERRQQELAEKAMQLTFVRARLKRLDTELLEWQRLQQALDRDGLPALETDLAGPELATTCNLILQDCMDSKFSVELVTQISRADGKGMKDDLTLLVTNNLTGNVRDIGDLSGGEEVIVAEAFMNAIAIFVNVRSQQPALTLFRDEADGDLSKENRRRYVRMLRKVQAISGAKQIVFISHDPDVQAEADAQIHVADGAVTVKLPPYREAA